MGPIQSRHFQILKHVLWSTNGETSQELGIEGSM